MALNTLIVVSQDDEHELVKQHYFVRNQTLRYQNCLQQLNVFSFFTYAYSTIAPFVQKNFAVLSEQFTPFLAQVYYHII